MTTKTPWGQSGGKKPAGRRALCSQQIAKLRAAVACRSCGAVPVEDDDGAARYHHRTDCYRVEWDSGDGKDEDDVTAC